MHNLCNSDESKDLVFNHLQGRTTETLYAAGICGWFFMKVVHDWCLLCRVPESTTLLIGYCSVLFQMAAVSSAFLWGMAASEVFVSPIFDGECACYYQLPDVESILALSTPFVLLIMLMTKMEAYLRSISFGDYLYMKQYDVPHHLVVESVRNPMSSMLIGTVSGRIQTATKLLRSRQELIYLLKLTKFFRVAFYLVLVCVGISSWPILVRLLSLLTIGDQHHDPSLRLVSIRIATIFWGYCLPQQLLSSLSCASLSGTVTEGSILREHKNGIAELALSGMHVQSYAFH